VGYPVTLVIDSVVGLVVLFLLPFMAAAASARPAGARARLNSRVFSRRCRFSRAAANVRTCMRAERNQRPPIPQEIDMRFMVHRTRPRAESEAGVMPRARSSWPTWASSTRSSRARGILLAGDGLKPSSQGARVVFNGTSRKVVDGPFAETKELVAGFWIWQVKSKEEAIEWVKRCPTRSRTASP
jgi:hypothetical protein